MVKMTVKPIIPKFANPQVVIEGLIDELDKEARVDRQSFEPTISTWTGSKPTFKSEFSRSTDSLSVHTGPGGNKKGVDKWIWLDQGTKAHQITARRAPSLAFFAGGFRAKTKVGSFKSGAGRKATRNFRRPISVWNSGIKKRGWSEKLAKERLPVFKRRIQARVDKDSKKLF